MKKRTKRILTVILVSILALMVYTGYSVYRLVAEGVPEAYAAWDSAILLIEYMETHDGNWPESWEDLLSAVSTLQNSDRFLRGHNADNVHRITELVSVDWDADPDQLRKVKWDGEGRPFDVVTRPDGSRFRMVWSEPNAIIWEYLTKKHEKE